MMKFNQDQDYLASVYCTTDFLSIETYSGLGRVRADPLFPPYLLPPDANDETIGEIVLQALSDSRTLSNLEERIAFFDIEKSKAQYAAWVAMLMEKYGYKTKKSLFIKMKSCGIHCVNSKITISPTRHEKREAWGGSGIKDSDSVILSIDNTPVEIGAGLRLALSRCKG